MTDPVFETWDEVEAWVRGVVLLAHGQHYHGEHVLGQNSEARIRRVIAAHSHLREIR